MFQKTAIWTLNLLLFLKITCGSIYVGKPLNIFQQFGDLDSVITVVPKHRIQFKELDSKEILEGASEIRRPFDHIDFHFDLCEDLSELEESLFNNYEIEGAAKSWPLLSAAWTRGYTAKRLGLHPNYVTRVGYGYGLVRVTRFHQMVSLKPNRSMGFKKKSAKLANLVLPGELKGVEQFMTDYGTHFVSSYQTGDSAYQVFVFNPSVFKRIQNAVLDYKSSLTRMDDILSFFSPWHAEQLGEVKFSSDGSSLKSWAAEHLHSRVFVFHFISLLKLNVYPDLLSNLCQLLGNNALLSVDLKTLAPFFYDDINRLWFEEVLDNRLKMWELNI